MARFISLLAIISFGGSMAYAEDSSNGCGVGWYVNSQTSLVGTSTRDTTNGTFPNTFSMTSGTSGCAKHTIVKNEMPAYNYVASNYDVLKIEMAQGHGENLSALARTFGCHDRAVDQFGEKIRENYQQVMDGTPNSPFDLFENVKTQISTDQYLSSNCHT